MASFIRNKLYLRTLSNTSVGFSKTGVISLVAFYRIINGNLSLKPNSAICSGFDYAIGVVQNSKTLFLAPGCTDLTFSLTTDPANMVLFSPAVKSGQIILNQIFGGVLIISGKSIEWRFCY